MADDIRVEIAQAIENFQLNEGELKRMLMGPNGPVMKELAQTGIRITNSVKAHATERPGPRVRSGRLRGSITWRLGEDSRSPYVDIGTNVFYAPFVELGHNIVRGGRVVGHAPPYPFLVPGMLAAIRG